LFYLVLFLFSTLVTDCTSTSYELKGNLFRTKCNLFRPKGNLFRSKGNLFRPKSNLFRSKGNLCIFWLHLLSLGI